MLFPHHQSSEVWCHPWVAKRALRNGPKAEIQPWTVKAHGNQGEIIIIWNCQGCQVVTVGRLSNRFTIWSKYVRGNSLESFRNLLAVWFVLFDFPFQQNLAMSHTFPYVNQTSIGILTNSTAESLSNHRAVFQQPRSPSAWGGGEDGNQPKSTGLIWLALHQILTGLLRLSQTQTALPPINLVQNFVEVENSQLKKKDDDLNKIQHLHIHKVYQNSTQKNI